MVYLGASYRGYSQYRDIVSWQNFYIVTSLVFAVDGRTTLLLGPTQRVTGFKHLNVLQALNISLIPSQMLWLAIFILLGYSVGAKKAMEI